MLTGLRGDRPVRDVCGEYEISEASFSSDAPAAEGGKTALATSRDQKPPDAAQLAEARKKTAQLERVLGKKTYELDIAGGSIAGLGVNERVVRSRAVAAKGCRPATVTRILQVSRRSVYRPISRRPAPAGPGRARPGEEAIVEVAKSNPIDGSDGRSARQS